jgi:sugar/nucleoside kinase (ribokinase family)
VFERVPEGTRLSYNPGSSEFREDPRSLLRLMKFRKPYLLALNETEIAQLHGEDAPDPTDPDRISKIARLPERTSKLAEFVLCTAGKDGIFLAHNNDTQRQKAQVVEWPKDTLGAGDRAHAAAIHGLTRRVPHDKILAEVAESAAQVVSHTGAHGDLYHSVYPHLS